MPAKLRLIGYNINIWRKASFVRLQTVSLGYNFNPALIKHLHMSSAKFCINATNAAVFSDWPLMGSAKRRANPKVLCGRI
jgi:hypothetical protein